MTRRQVGPSTISPLAPFSLEQGGPCAETPPRGVGADTDVVPARLGCPVDEIGGFRGPRRRLAARQKADR